MKLFSWRKSRAEERCEEQTEPKTVKLSEIADSKVLYYHLANLQGIGNRSNQEDSFGFANALDTDMIKSRGLLAVVTDGMGGMKDGSLASGTAVECLRNDFKRINYENSVPHQLEESVIDANEKIYELLDGDGGSTLVACVFYDEKAYFASVGDSYIILIRNGRLIHLNRKHNVMYEKYLSAVCNGTLDRTEAENDPEKNALTSFLGMEFLDEIDISTRPLPIMDGDVFLLCSDGVGGVLSEECILNCITNNYTPEMMCEQLGKSIIAENSKFQDNYTAIIVKCEY